MASIQTAIELNDQFSSVLYGIMDSVNIAIASMYDMQEAMSADVDVSSLDSARESIHQATAALMEMNEALDNQTSPGSSLPSAAPEPIEVPVTWQTDNLEVFTGIGIDRFQQEVQSANDMLNTLNTTQAHIAQTADGMDILPDAAMQDISGMGLRLQEIQQRIQQIEGNPVNFGTDTANAELEQLRARLNQAVQAQNELNDAMQGMDVSAANDAYLRLSQTVSNTERYIRDNTDEQGRFNQEIQEGISGSNELVNMIKRAVGAYVSIQGVGKILNMSDELSQTTSRLDLMNNSFNQINGTANETSELVNMVYAAAQDARGSFGDMASVVARFGNNARDAFGSSEEVVAFADLVQKQMTIAGASTQEAANAELQLSQALGSGVLRGDELNSIFEQAPNLIQNIADYLDVPIGQIRDMAADGEITADIVKAAIFAAADDINGKFDEMPMTWGQAWTKMQNAAVMTFQTVLQRINDAANSDVLVNLTDGVIDAMGVIASIVLTTFDTVSSVGGFIADNWSIISPVIYGVAAALAVYAAYLGIVKGMELLSKAATLANNVLMSARIGITAALTRSTMEATATQMGYNGALYACPIVWIIILVIALIAAIYAVVAVINKVTGSSISATGVICGAVATAGAFILNVAIGLINAILQAAWNTFVEPFIGIIEFVLNVANGGFDSFGDACANLIGQIISWFLSLGKVVTRIIDAIFGTNWTAGLSSLQESVISWGKNENAITLERDAPAIEKHFGYIDAYNVGYDFGQGIDEKISEFDPSKFLGKNEEYNVPDPEAYTAGLGGALDGSSIGDNLGSIADDTGAIKDSMDITQEDLKYLRDLAEQETVNRYTVAEITIDQSGMQNTINSGDDIDGFVAKLTDSVNEAVDNMTEGVHK